MFLPTRLLCRARQALTLEAEEEQLEFPANTLYQDHPTFSSEYTVQWTPAAPLALRYDRLHDDINLPLDTYRTQEFYQEYLERRDTDLYCGLTDFEDWWFELPGKRIDHPEPFYPLRRYYPRRIPSTSWEKPVFVASPIATPTIRRCFSLKVDYSDLYGRLRELKKNPLLNFRAGRYRIYVTKKKAKFEELTKQQRRAIKNRLLHK